MEFSNPREATLIHNRTQTDSVVSKFVDSLTVCNWSGLIFISQSIIKERYVCCQR